MRNFQDKNKWRRFRESKPILVGLGVILLVFAWSVLGLMGKMQETLKNKNSAEEKISELEVKRKKLSNNINKLETDEGKEESIREKFGWVKEGEGVIVIVDEKATANVNDADQSSGFFSWIKNLFK